MQEESEGDLRRGQGLALLRFGAGMFEGGNFGNNISKSAAAASQVYGDAIRANQSKKSALQNMRINLVEAQRKEQMGLNRDAVALQDQARRDGDAAQKFELDRVRAVGVLREAEARAKRAATPKPAAALRVDQAVLQATVDTRIAKEKPLAGETPEQQRARITAEVGPQILAQTRASTSVTDVGGTRAGLMSSGQDLDATKAAEGLAQKNIERLAFFNAEYRNKKTTPDRKAEMELQVRNEARAAFGLPPMAPTKSDAGKTPPPGAGKALPASKIPTGTTFGKVVPGKGTEVLKDGKVIGYAN